jgi:hypothetical protein
MCLFREPVEDSALLASIATGLPAERLTQQDALITEDDIANARSDRRDFLRLRLGKPKCSVIPEAIAQHISAEKQKKGFEPSAPFIACFSACLVVAELLRTELGSARLEGRFQFDFLRGPESGDFFPVMRRQTCICTSRRSLIQKVKAKR